MSLLLVHLPQGPILMHSSADASYSPSCIIQIWIRDCQLVARSAPKFISLDKNSLESTVLWSSEFCVTLSCRCPAEWQISVWSLMYEDLAAAVTGAHLSYSKFSGLLYLNIGEGKYSSFILCSLRGNHFALTQPPLQRDFANMDIQTCLRQKERLLSREWTGQWQAPRSARETNPLGGTPTI